MFCPSCGAEYTQKTNYCKGCGSSLNATGNKVEVNLPQPRVDKMFWAVGVFGFFGLIISLILLFFALFPPDPSANDKQVQAVLGLAAVVCFAFTFLVTVLLSWQLGRYISTFRESVKQLIKKEQLEIQIPPQPVSSPQTPSYVPVTKEPVFSVTEHTTRSINPPIETGSDSER